MAMELVGGSVAVRAGASAAGVGWNFKEVNRTGRLSRTECLKMPTLERLAQRHC